MKVLITGGTGQVGHALLQTCPENYDTVAPTRQALDLEDSASLYHQLVDLVPDAVINCAAYTDVDKAEEEATLVEHINVHAVARIASYCHDHAIPMIQISTDFVFDGRQNRPYSVTDAPNSIGQYARSKRLGELATIENCPHAYIVRSSWVYGKHGNNFVKTMLHLGQQNKALRVVNDQIGSPTSAQNLAAFIWRVLERRPKLKVLHCSDAGQINWYEFALAIFAEAREAGLLNAQPDISACSTVDYQAPAARPAYSALECEPSFAALGMQQTEWRVGLRKMLTDLAAAGKTESGEMAQVISL